METSELNTCPVCADGGKPGTFAARYGYFSGCNACGIQLYARVNGEPFLSEAAAIAAWNALPRPDVIEQAAEICRKDRRALRRLLVEATRNEVVAPPDCIVCSRFAIRNSEWQYLTDTNKHPMTGYATEREAADAAWGFPLSECCPDHIADASKMTTLEPSGNPGQLPGDARRDEILKQVLILDAEEREQEQEAAIDFLAWVDEQGCEFSYSGPFNDRPQGRYVTHGISGAGIDGKRVEIYADSVPDVIRKFIDAVKGKTITFWSGYDQQNIRRRIKAPESLVYRAQLDTRPVGGSLLDDLAAQEARIDRVERAQSAFEGEVAHSTGKILARLEALEARP
jgi:uncharacterized protein YciI